MDSICIPIRQIFSPWTYVLLAEVILAFIFFGPSLFLKGLKDKWLKFLYAGVSIPLFIFLSLFLFVLIMIFYGEEYDQPIASKYFPLNAGIKNTCYLDPERKNCPKSVEELINIESIYFKNLTQNVALKYEYYPDTHWYSLVVIEKDTLKGVIFDPRLKDVKNYGYQDDYFDITASYCGGKYSVDNPPQLKGPWDNI